MSLSNRQIKLINSLHSKKGRKENLKFLVEGEKVINELINSNWSIDFIVLNEKYTLEYQNQANIYFLPEESITKLSSLQTNTFGIAIVEMKKSTENIFSNIGLTLFLDGIRDPGNLGTIIRICDWYGIKTIFTSFDSTEFYNPKTIISTMGSFIRINVVEISFLELVKNLPKHRIVGTFLEGTSIYEYSFKPNQIIVLGNESTGIRADIERLVQDQITIPKIGEAESLNVGISTAIVLDNAIRKLMI